MDFALHYHRPSLRQRLNQPLQVLLTTCSLRQSFHVANKGNCVRVRDEAIATNAAAANRHSRCLHHLGFSPLLLLHGAFHGVHETIVDLDPFTGQRLDDLFGLRVWVRLQVIADRLGLADFWP